jgi:hypothetical protein
MFRMKTPISLFLFFLCLFSSFSTQALRADQFFSESRTDFLGNVAVNPQKDTPLEKSDVRHLVNIGYEVGYSETLKNPLWSFYILKDLKYLMIFFNVPKVLFMSI